VKKKFIEIRICKYSAFQIRSSAWQDAILAQTDLDNKSFIFH